MPRIVRGLGDDVVYHVINRGNGRQEVFHKDKDYEAFLKLMKAAKERHPVKVYGYCLMPNHFHMAVRPEKGEDLNRWMQWLMKICKEFALESTVRRRGRPRKETAE